MNHPSDQPPPPETIKGHILPFLDAYDAGTHDRSIRTLECKCERCQEAFLIGQDDRDGSIDGVAERKAAGYGEMGPF